MDIKLLVRSSFRKRLLRKFMDIKTCEFKSNRACYDVDGNQFQGNVYYFEIVDNIVNLFWPLSSRKYGVEYIFKKLDEPLLYSIDEYGDAILCDDIYPCGNFTWLSRIKNYWLCIKESFSVLLKKKSAGA